MGSLQVRLFLSYLVIIAVTLGLTAFGLFLLLGGYRDSISYGNLEDVGVLINEQANAEIRSIREANQSGTEPLSGQDLLRNQCDESPIEAPIQTSPRRPGSHFAGGSSRRLGAG